MCIVGLPKQGVRRREKVERQRLYLNTENEKITTKYWVWCWGRSGPPSSDVHRTYIFIFSWHPIITVDFYYTLPGRAVLSCSPQVRQQRAVLISVITSLPSVHHDYFVLYDVPLALTYKLHRLTEERGPTTWMLVFGVLWSLPRQLGSAARLRLHNVRCSSIFLRSVYMHRDSNTKTLIKLKTSHIYQDMSI